MSNDVEFVDGLIVKAPPENSPDFVKGSISIKRKDLGNWLRKRTEDWINLDIKVSKKGVWYASVNTWKPEKKDSPQQPADPTDDLDDDIPF